MFAIWIVQSYKKIIIPIIFCGFLFLKVADFLDLQASKSRENGKNDGFFDKNTSFSEKIDNLFGNVEKNA